MANNDDAVSINTIRLLAVSISATPVYGTPQLDGLGLAELTGNTSRQTQLSGVTQDTQVLPCKLLSVPLCSALFFQDSLLIIVINAVQGNGSCSPRVVHQILAMQSLSPRLVEP